MRSSKEQKAERGKEILPRQVERLFFFLNLYRFQGSESESLTKPDMYFENCTARWKKHLVKKPVANVFKRTHERRKANNFAVGLRRKS